MTRTEESIYIADSINSIAGLFKAAHEICRIAHGTAHYDFRCLRIIPVVFLQILTVIGYRIESEILSVRIAEIGMIHHIARRLHRLTRFGSRRDLTVYVAAHVAEKIPIIRPAATREIMCEIGSLHRIHAHDIIIGIGHGGREHRSAGVCRLYEGFALLGGDTESHTVDKHHVIVASLLQFLRRQFIKLDPGVVVSFRHLP